MGAAWVHGIPPLALPASTTVEHGAASPRAPNEFAELQEHAAAWKGIVDDAAALLEDADKVAAGARVRSAADFLERTLLDSWKPRYEKLVSRFSHHMGVLELLRDLQDDGHVDVATAIQAAAEEAGLSIEALEALEELRHETSSIAGCKAEYASAEAVQEDVKAAGLGSFHAKAVAHWFPAYTRVRTA